MSGHKSFPTIEYHPICVKTKRRKLSYPTKAAAKRAARSGKYRGSNAQNVYKCQHCGNYHLTSQEKRSAA